MLHTVMTPAVYGYIAGIALIFVTGVIVQFKFNKKDKEPQESENQQYFVRNRRN